MEIKSIDNDINVLCVTAQSFPDGIVAAYDKLFEIFPHSEKRKIFGISFGAPDGKIIYKAAAKDEEGDNARSHGLEKFTIRKGEYLTEVLNDWIKDVTQIGNTFQKLLTDPRVDKSGYCVEDYFNDEDVLCMVTLKS
jgi:hypothetical protein